MKIRTRSWASPSSLAPPDLEAGVEGVPDIDKVVLYAWSEVCSVCLRPKVLDLRAILPGNTKVGTSVSRAYRMQFPGNPAFFMFYTSYLFCFVFR